jgi:hypothetical protein
VPEATVAEESAVVEEAVARRTPTGWRVGGEEVPDLTSAMVLADLLAADLPSDDQWQAPGGAANRPPVAADQATISRPEAAAEGSASPGTSARGEGTRDAGTPDAGTPDAAPTGTPDAAPTSTHDASPGTGPMIADAATGATARDASKASGGSTDGGSIMTGTGGESTTAGTADAEPNTGSKPTVYSTSSCGCRTVGAPASRGGIASALLVTLMFVVRLRPRRRRAQLPEARAQLPRPSTNGPTRPNGESFEPAPTTQPFHTRSA